MYYWYIIKLESKDKLKEIDNKICTCYHSDDIIRVMDRDNDFDFNDILLDEKLYKEKDENILFYGIS